MGLQVMGIGGLCMCEYRMGRYVYLHCIKSVCVLTACTCFVVGEGEKLSSKCARDDVLQLVHANGSSWLFESRPITVCIHTGWSLLSDSRGAFHYSTSLPPGMCTTHLTASNLITSGGNEQI